jgi:protein gp37
LIYSFSTTRYLSIDWLRHGELTLTVSGMNDNHISNLWRFAFTGGGMHKTKFPIAGVAYFFKQWGTWGADGRKRSKHANGRELDGQTWEQYPAGLTL